VLRTGWAIVFRRRGAVGEIATIIEGTLMAFDSGTETGTVGARTRDDARRGADDGRPGVQDYRPGAGGDGRFVEGGDGPPVVFRDVFMGFGEGDVLRGVSFAVAARETLVLLGETGTGKTLTLKLAAGLLKPTRGSVSVLGQDLSTMTEKELLHLRQRIGFVFQEGALFDSMTVGENVAYRLREEHCPEEEIEKRVAESLEFVELGHTAEQLPSELSGGMRRRVSIARALINRPDIVLYDSPTAGLDPVTSQTIIALILRLRDVFGVTALLATQRLQDGFALANFRFDKKSKQVVRMAAAAGAGGARGVGGDTGRRESGGPGADASADGEQPAATHFLVYKDGHVYFEGDPGEMAASKDPYLRRFLV
jgi:phospholipid/cholesterol/gamma-HCH transport system ATP-binding protein